MGKIKISGASPILPDSPRFSPILWEPQGPATEGMETNFEFDFYENLMTEAIVTSKSEWECRQLRSQAVEVCPSAPLASVGAVGRHGRSARHVMF